MKIERKMMAHYLDGSMTETPAYHLLGIDLEEFNVDMNPNLNQLRTSLVI